MGKLGKEKNTRNKNKHTELIERIKNKKRTKKELRTERLKAITKAAQEAANKKVL
jgi:hypothetical protein